MDLGVHRPRILVVDDDEVITDLLSETLRSQRFEVDVARSTEEALPLILFHDYKGILLDLVLPDVNGLALFRQIARRRPALAPRVIFVTGALAGGEAGRFIRLVDNRVLMKPLDPGDVIDAVLSVVPHAEQAREDQAPGPRR